MAHIINEDCIACGTCIDECPVEAISEGDKYHIDPEMCTDCGTCADACPAEAIHVDGFEFVSTTCNKLIMAHIINEDCIACGTCIDECPVGAISEGDKYHIDPEMCTDCGTCADACPVEAIHVDEFEFISTTCNKIIPEPPFSPNIHKSEIKPQK